MDRLTIRNGEGVAYFKGEKLRLEPYEMDSRQVGEALRKLADYEDIEEQGRLIKLPCKVGDKIFLDFAGFGKDVDEFTVKDFHLDCFEDGGVILFCDYESDDKALTGQIDVMNFGKTAFLARKEAEQNNSKDRYRPIWLGCQPLGMGHRI